MTYKHEAIQQFDNLTAQLYRHLMSILSNSLQGEITPSQLLIMRQIHEDTTTVGDIANKLEISPAAVSKFVDHLVKDGLVSRRRSKKDRRVCYLALTPQGEAVYNNNTAIRYDIFKNILSCFNKDELETFIELTSRIVDRLEYIDR